MSGYVTVMARTVSLTLDAGSQRVYELWLRFQAGVELAKYVGGVTEGYVNRGGLPTVNFTNTLVKLEVDKPAQILYLNNGSVATNYSVPLDYHFKLLVLGDATLQLSLLRGDHTMYYADQGGGTVQAGDLAPFVGEFAQLDFVSTLKADVYEERAGAGTMRDWLFSGYEDNVLATKAEK